MVSFDTVSIGACVRTHTLELGCVVVRYESDTTCVSYFINDELYMCIRAAHAVYNGEFDIVER